MLLFKSREIIVYIKQPFNIRKYENTSCNSMISCLTKVGSEVRITNYDKRKDIAKTLYIDGCRLEDVNIYNMGLTELLDKCSTDIVEKNKVPIIVYAKNDFNLCSLRSSMCLAVKVYGIKTGDELEIISLCDEYNKNKYLFIINGNSLEINNLAGSLKDVLDNCSETFKDNYRITLDKIKKMV